MLDMQKRDVGLIPGSGRFPEVGNGNPLQHSCLGNPTDRGTWQAKAHGSQSQTRLSTHEQDGREPSVYTS